jgi:predicted RND superfamily exporter protein
MTSPDDYPGLSESKFTSELFGQKFKAYMETRTKVLTGLGRAYAAQNWNFLTGFKPGSQSSIKLAWVSFNATIPIVNTVEEANTWYDRWEDFRKSYTNGLGGFQTTDVYIFMVTQNEMVKAAVLGIALSLVVAYIVMIITTLNWWIATLGFVNIACISVVFLGTMPLLRWSLGQNECIFLIAVVGLSVDYTVHLLHSYKLASGSRLDRSRIALTEMGISVVNSSLTTLLASVVLFGCGFFFFFQFGAFIFFVIGYSIVMSITLLIPLLMLIGPGENQGDIKKYFTKCTEKVPGESEKQ